MLIKQYKFDQKIYVVIDPDTGIWAARWLQMVHLGEEKGYGDVAVERFNSSPFLDMLLDNEEIFVTVEPDQLETKLLIELVEGCKQQIQPKEEITL